MKIYVKCLFKFEINNKKDIWPLFKRHFRFFMMSCYVNEIGFYFVYCYDCNKNLAKERFLDSDAVL